MTPNRRIFLNIIATYGRSLLALVFGLFSSRWVLMSLGQCDYGLYGVVGGITAFIAFFNGLLGAAVSRFYAVAVGQAEAELNKASGLEECRRWFNIAVTIHTVLPIILIAIGYPIGEWAVRNYLTIPPDRVGACVWVFRFACITCFFAMVNGPFSAMYYAKQYIVELTIYGFVQTTLNFIFLYFMITHPGDWLVKYAFVMCLISTIPQILICIRAFQVFQECRIRARYLWSWKRFKKLGAYAFWQTFGAVGYILRGQGIAILINRMFGPLVNTAMSIANSVNGQASMLSMSLQTAFQPAIVTKYGSGDKEGAVRLAFRACKFGLLLVLIFVIPLSLELPEVMRIWLKEPPRYAAGLCWCMFAILVIDKCTIGHMIAVNARGKVALYQFVVGGSVILSLPLAWLFCRMKLGVYSVGWAMVISMSISTLSRVVFARCLVRMSIRRWLVEIMIPIALSTFVISSLAYQLRFVMPPSFVRVCLTTGVVEVLLIPFVWKVVLDASEKEFVQTRLSNFVMKLRQVR